MSGTVLDHRLVRDYLQQLDAAMRGLPTAQAHELKEQITAHLDDALRPDAGDHEVAATLSRLGTPADLAAEAADGLGRRRVSWGVRWRLAAIVAVPTVIAALLGARQIGNNAGHVVTFGREQQLGRLNAAVVRLTQNLEDERDLSAAYAARNGTGRPAGPVPGILANARMATDASVRTVRADAAGVGAGDQTATVQDLKALLASANDLGAIRKTMSAAPSASPSVSTPGQVITEYTDDVIGPANSFCAAVGGGTNDASIQGTVTTLAALLRAENEESVQRAIVYAALSTRPPVFPPSFAGSLQQAFQSENADLADFNAATDTAEQQLFSTTVSGPAVSRAAAQEDLAEEAAAAQPSASLTAVSGLDAATWYANMSTTIGDMRQVTGQEVSQLTARTTTLEANATRSLLLASIVTFLLCSLVLLLATALARSLARSLVRADNHRPFGK